MTKLNKLAIIAGISFAGLAGQAMADPICGLNTGEAATGAPIIVGGIHGNAAPGDFSASTDAAKAYFDCVNANGGINGRPVDYRVENDQWNPEQAAQAAAKLVDDAGAVHGNGCKRADLRGQGHHVDGRCLRNFRVSRNAKHRFDKSRPPALKSRCDTIRPRRIGRNQRGMHCAEHSQQRPMVVQGKHRLDGGTWWHRLDGFVEPRRS